MRTAVKLMCAGAAVSTVTVITALALIPAVKAALRTATPSLTAAEVSDANTLITLAIVFGLAVIGVPCRPGGPDPLGGIDRSVHALFKEEDRPEAEVLIGKGGADAVFVDGGRRDRAEDHDLCSQPGDGLERAIALASFPCSPMRRPGPPSRRTGP